MELNLLDLHELLDTFKVMIYDDYKRGEKLRDCMESFESLMNDSKISLSKIGYYNNSVVLYTEPTMHNIYFHDEGALVFSRSLIYVGEKSLISVYSDYIIKLLKSQGELTWIPDIFSRIRKELKEMKSNE